MEPQTLHAIFIGSVWSFGFMCGLPAGSFMAWLQARNWLQEKLKSGELIHQGDLLDPRRSPR